jgi:hypothetical protein
MQGFGNIRGGLFAAVVVVIAALGCSQFDNVPSASAVAGTYDGEVTGGEGKGERFDITFEQRSKTYTVKWKTRGGEFSGTGVNMGNYVGVTFAEEGSDAVCGTMFYRSFGPQTMNGVAAVLGKEDFGSENLSRVSGEGFEGEFGINGRQPDGGDYSGTLVLKKSGERFDATWMIDGKEAKGIGYTSGNMLAVAFGDDGCRFAVYRNDRGFFEGSDVVRFTGKIGDANGFYSDVKIEKRSAARSAAGE